jgi:hypothetical protein
VNAEFFTKDRRGQPERFTAESEEAALDARPGQPVGRLRKRRTYTELVPVNELAREPYAFSFPGGLPDGIVLSHHVPEWMRHREDQLDEEQAHEALQRETQRIADARDGLTADGLLRLGAVATHARAEASRLRREGDAELRRLGQHEGEPTEVAERVHALLRDADAWDQTAIAADRELGR